MDNNDNWTVGGKEYVDERFDSVESEIDTRIHELHREHDKFEETVKQSFVKQNEFRGSLEDARTSMATRNEMDALDTKFDTRVARVEGLQSRIIGALILIAFILPAVTSIITYLITFHH